MPPADGSPKVMIASAMQKNAPHPNAARLFINYMRDPATQLAYANGWMVSVVDASSTLPIPRQSASRA